MTAPFDAVVLGGGPAGLAAAWYASRSGRRVALVERAPRVGGLAGSFDIAGIPVDYGSHRLHERTDPALLADVQTLLGDELQLRARRGRIRLGGRWLEFPLRAADLVRRARVGFAAAVLRDVAGAPLRRHRDGGEDTFAARVRAGFGPAVAETFYEPYARKLFGIPATELSGELFRRRVGARSGAGVLRRVVRRGPRPGFWYPSGGFGRISEALAAAAAGAGAVVVTGVAAAAIEPGIVPTVVLADGRRWPARTIVSTLPAAMTTALYDGAVPAAVHEAARALETRAARLAYLVVPRRPYTAFDAHYFPEPHVPMARLSEPLNYRDRADDPDDRTVLCAELPGSPADPWWTLGADELGRLVAAALVAEGLPDPTPIDVVVRTAENVYPVYRVGHEAHQAVLEGWAEGVDELVLVGRQPLFAHDNTHHALAMGQAVAACLTADGFDRLRWTSRREAFRRHVVED